MGLLSKAEFSRHLGVTPARVTYMAKQGMPVGPDGRIDVASAEGWMRANLRPQAHYQDRGAARLLGGASPPPPPPPPPPSQSPPSPPRGRPPAPAPPGSFNLLHEKGRETHYRANKAELDYKERDGQLLDAGAVRREWESIIADSRGRVLACPSRIAARLPHLTLTDIAEIRLEITAALMELGSGHTG